MPAEKISPTDAALVAAALKNPADFTKIVERWEPPLRRFLGKFLWGAADLDDTLQDIFLKIYENLRDADPARPFGPWAYRIAHNSAISALRRAKIRRAISLDAPPADPDETPLGDRIPDDLDLPAEISEKRRGDAVRRALGELRTADREILVLRFFEEKNYDEIGEILRQPPGTVATNLSRAKKRFAELARRLGLDQTF